MPKDPKRNIPSFQLQGGQLNEFEFQKNQSEMADESALPFNSETSKPNQDPAERVAETTAEAHRKVEQRRKRAVVKSKSRKKSPAGKKSAKKAAKKPAKKKPIRAGTKKRSTVKSRRQKSSTKR